jgi:hypothetical protein
MEGRAGGCEGRGGGRAIEERRRTRKSRMWKEKQEDERWKDEKAG